MPVSTDLVCVVVMCAACNILAVWGILRHEVRGIRAEVARAHGRLDTLESMVHA